MIKGTTPTHTFNIPFDTSLVKVCRIIYAQNDEVLFIKTNEDCTLEGSVIKTRLTQEDTFMFDHNKPVQIQLRILTKNGESLSSVINKVGVSNCLGNEVLV